MKSCCGILAAVGLFALAPVVGYHVHDLLADEEVRQEVAVVEAALQRRAQQFGSTLAGCGEALAALRDLFDASEEVTGEEFWLFAERARRRHPGMIAIAWAPARASGVVGAGPALDPVQHVTPPAIRPLMEAAGPEVDAGRQLALARAVAAKGVIVGPACFVPPEHGEAQLAELWLVTGDERPAAVTSGHFGLLVALVDLDELFADAPGEEVVCELVPAGAAARVPANPAVHQRTLPVADGHWLLSATTADPAARAHVSVAPLQWGIAATVGWALFALGLLRVGWWFRHEGQRRQSQITTRVMGSLTDTVVVTDRRGRLVAANGSAVRLLGQPPEDGDVARWLATAYFVDPTTSAPDPAARTPLAAALAGMPRGEVLRLQPASDDRDAKWFAITAHPILGEARQCEGAVVIVRDVTARQQQAEHVERLSRAVDQTTDMVLIAGQDGSVQYVNPAFTALTGYDRDEALGNRDFLRDSGLYGREDFTRVRGQVLRGLRFHGAITCYRKDGTPFATEQAITPLLDDSGRVTHVVVVCKDMTEHNRLLANEVELQIAAAVQRRTFPRSVPALPGLEVAGATNPAASTSGDVYDWVMRPDGSLVVVVGDASGHGLGPALLVSEVHALLRCLLAMPLPLAEVLSRLHHLLTPDLPDDGFVTLLMVEIDPVSRRLRWLNAGHEPGLLLAPGREPVRLTATGPALGVVELGPDAVAVEGPPFTAGMVLLLHSDGVTEHPLAGGGRLGENGVTALVEEVLDRPADFIVAHVGERLRATFAAGASRDDATVLVVRAVPGNAPRGWQGPPAPA